MREPAQTPSWTADAQQDGQAIFAAIAGGEAPPTEVYERIEARAAHLADVAEREERVAIIRPLAAHAIRALTGRSG